MHRLLVFICVCFLLMPSVVFAQTDASAVQSSLLGRIVLDVERNGEAWYVSPADGLRYSLGRPDEALALMRHFALGISNSNLEQIPLPSSALQGDAVLRQRLSGRILLQVESRGEAWYVDPRTNRRHFMGRPHDAFELMRASGLGISAEDLARMPQGVLVAADIDDVPFYAQAPRGNWSDPRQQEGCEEASVLMAVDWVKGRVRTAEQAENAIISMSEFEREHYGAFIDTSSLDTFDRLFIEHQSFFHGEYLEGIDATDVLEELAEGNIVVLPVNGQKLGNPYFQRGGPLRHMIVVHGYDHVSGEFITHEPGTTRGKDYRYSYATLASSINDYESGKYEPLPVPPRTAMIIVSPEL